MKRTLLGISVLLVLAVMILARQVVQAAPPAQATATAPATTAAQTTTPAATVAVTSTVTAPSPGATETISQTGHVISATVGFGRETLTLNSFFPYLLKVHVGDTVSWKINSDEIHTVSFSDGKIPPGADPKTFIVDSRFDAGPDDRLPGPFAPIPGGGPTDIQLTPLTNFPTRGPGAPVETWDGTGFVSSGVLSDVAAGPPGTPPNDTFQVQFTKPGMYTYICLIHYGSMQGIVQVVPTTDTDVPTQADVDAQTKKEIDNLTPLLDQAKVVAEQPLKDAGPDNHSFWYVRNGNADEDTFDMRVQLLQFGPKDLTIKAGDTVVWSSTYFHTVTFNPAPPPPEFPVVKPQANGPPILVAPANIMFPVKPDAVYDPTKYYNSGVLLPGGPNGTAWALTFDKPGTYEYFCAVHRIQGMKGTIIVTP